MTLNASVAFTGDAASLQAAARTAQAAIDAVGRTAATTSATVQQAAGAVRDAVQATSSVGQSAPVDPARIRLLEQEAARLDDLRAKYVPLYSAQRQYRQYLDEIADAERRGVLASNEAASARAQVKASFAERVRTLDETVQAERRDAAAVEALTRTYQPLQTAIRQLAADEERLRDLRDRGRIDAATYQTTAAAIEQQRRKLSELGTTQTGVAETGRLAAYQVANLSAQLQDVVVQLGSGTNVFQVLLQQGPQATSAVGGVGNALRLLATPAVAAAAGVLAVGAAIAIVIARAQDLQQEARDLSVALKAAGDTSAASFTQAQASIRGLERQGVSRGDARQIVTGLARNAQLSPEAAQRVAGLSVDAAAAFGTDPIQAAQTLTQALTGGYASLERLIAQLNLFDAAQIKTIRNLYEQGRAGEAQKLVLDGLASRFDGLNRESLSPAAQALRELSNSWTEFMDAISTSRPVVAAVELLGSALKTLAGSLPPEVQAQDQNSRRMLANDRQIMALEGDVATLRSAGYGDTDPEIKAKSAEILRLRAENEALLTRVRQAAVPGGASGSGTGGSNANQVFGQTIFDRAIEASERARTLLGLTPAGRVAQRIQYSVRDAATQDIGGAIDPNEAAAIARQRTQAASDEASQGARDQSASLDRSIRGQLALARAARESGAAQIRANAAMQAGETAATQYGTSVDALTRQLVDQAAASAAAGGGEVLRALSRQAEAAQRIAAAAVNGPAAAAEQERLERIRETTAALEAARDATTDPNIKAALNDQIAQFGSLSQTIDEAAKARAQLARISDQRDELRAAEAEQSLIGASPGQRAAALAQLRTEQRLRREGISLTSDRSREEIALARRLAETSEETRRQEAVFQDLARTVEQSFDTIGNAITEAFIQGRGAAVTFGSVVQGVLSQILSQLVKLAIINPILNGIFGNAGGQRATIADAGGLLGRLFGPSEATRAVATAGGGLSGVPLYHTGGIVGSGSPRMRFVDPAVFSGARRYHAGGVAGDEVPAILRRGEGVFTADQMAAMGGGSRVTVNVINQGGSQVDVQQSPDGRGGVNIDVLIRDTVRSQVAGGGMDAVFRSRFGLIASGQGARP